jgi:hypothetical protein
VVTGIVETDGGTSGEGAIQEEKIKGIGRTRHRPIVCVCKQEEECSSRVAARRRRRNSSDLAGTLIIKTESAVGKEGSVAAAMEMELTNGVRNRPRGLHRDHQTECAWRVPDLGIIGVITVARGDDPGRRCY